MTATFLKRKAQFSLFSRRVMMSRRLAIVGGLLFALAVLSPVFFKLNQARIALRRLDELESMGVQIRRSTFHLRHNVRVDIRCNAVGRNQAWLTDVGSRIGKTDFVRFLVLTLDGNTVSLLDAIGRESFVGVWESHSSPLLMISDSVLDSGVARAIAAAEWPAAIALRGGRVDAKSLNIILQSPHVDTFYVSKELLDDELASEIKRAESMRPKIRVFIEDLGVPDEHDWLSPCVSNDATPCR